MTLRRPELPPSAQPCRLADRALVWLVEPDSLTLRHMGVAGIAKGLVGAALLLWPLTACSADGSGSGAEASMPSSSESVNLPTTKDESDSGATTQGRQPTSEVLRLDRLPSDMRPDCSDGEVTRLIPGHSGWSSLRRAAAGLLRHPGADHSVIAPMNNAGVIVVLYRDDDTIKAAARLRRLDGRWFPNSIALCRATVS